PTPAPWVTCGLDCPGNAFMVIAHEPSVVAQFANPVRELLTIGFLAVVIGRLGHRIRAATRLGRRTLTPVLVAAMASDFALGTGLPVRRPWPGSALMDGAFWLIALTVPAMAVAFLIGLTRWWVYVGASLRRIAERVAEPRRRA